MSCRNSLYLFLQIANDTFSDPQALVDFFDRHGNARILCVEADAPLP